MCSHAVGLVAPTECEAERSSLSTPPPRSTCKFSSHKTRLVSRSISRPLAVVCAALYHSEQSVLMRDGWSDVIIIMQHYESFEGFSRAIKLLLLQAGMRDKGGKFMGVSDDSSPAVR